MRTLSEILIAVLERGDRFYGWEIDQHAHRHGVPRHAVESFIAAYGRSVRKDCVLTEDEAARLRVLADRIDTRTP